MKKRILSKEFNDSNNWSKRNTCFINVLINNSLSLSHTQSNNHSFNADRNNIGSHE